LRVLILKTPLIFFGLKITSNFSLFIKFCNTNKNTAIFLDLTTGHHLPDQTTGFNDLTTGHHLPEQTTGFNDLTTGQPVDQMTTRMSDLTTEL
jgi:hypothetical protein